MMRSTRLFGLLLTGLCVTATAQTADPGTTPASVVRAWAAAFNACSAEQLAALYDPQASLWGTNASVLTDSHGGIRAYFDRACAARPPIRVELGSGLTRVHGESATVAGSYTFSREGATYPSRYSFVLVRQGEGWRIVHHHSSALPSR